MWRLPLGDRWLWFTPALSSSPGQVPTHEERHFSEGKVAAVGLTSAMICGCSQTFAAQTGTRFRFRRQTQLRPASSYEHRFPLSCKALVPPGRERRACCGYLNQARGLTLLPQGKTTTSNYSLKHARSGSDRVAASTSPLRSRPRRPGPLRSYLEVIFIRFRGPQPLKDRVESRVPAAENKPVTARAFIHFRGPKALLDIIRGRPFGVGLIVRIMLLSLIL